MQRLLILLLIIINNSTACVPLGNYVSDFDHKSLLNSKGYFDNPILYFSTKKNKEGECTTIVSLKSGKIIDSYPTKDDKEKICPDFNGYHEISLVDKVVYKNHLLAILVINEYSVSFANRGINPYFGYHLYIYRDKNGILEKAPMFDKFGWGGGYKIGNQNMNNEELICNKKKMPYINTKSIKTYLDSIGKRGIGLEVTKRGIVDYNAHKIINKYITTMPTSYFFYINKKNEIKGIFKEVRLGSSQAKCFTPVYINNKDYIVKNTYCYDREIVHDKINSIFYIYDTNVTKLKNFTYYTPDDISYVRGKTQGHNIVFSNVPINLTESKHLIKNNIMCVVRGKDFFDSNFDLFQCRIDLNQKININTIDYIDIFILANTLNSYPLAPKTLTQYNNIAYYLQKAGANEEAVYLLEKIIKKFPNRTVAYINLGDAYWALGEKEKAKKAYTTYIEQMCNKGLQKKIPKEVLKRVERKDVCK